MPDRNDHVALQLLGKPWRGKNRKRILEQETLTTHQTVVKNQEVASHAQNITARTNGTNLIPEMIVKLHQFLKGWNIFLLVLLANVLVPVFDRRTKNAGTM